MDHDRESENLPFALLEVVLPDVPLTDLLMRITDLATRTIPNCSVAGLTVLQDGVMATPVYSDERSPRIDAAQYAADEGPCLSAFRDGTVQHIHDTRTETRWRAFCDAALSEGINCTLSAPLLIESGEGSAFGALNLYSETPAGFGPDTLASAESFAHQAAILMANARAYWGAKELSDQLEQALESRATIEQAKGIIIAQSRVDPDEAFQILVRASQRQNRKLRVIATEIVERAQRKG